MTKGNKQKRVAYIVQEMISNGELYGYIANSGPFGTAMTKYYFKQMLAGILHIYTKGFSHRDLKPENILLDANYNVKIVDFGFACKIDGRDGSGANRSCVGTPGYMAPEILARHAYQGNVVDIFALAVILFCMYAGHPPFEQATATDAYYRYFVANKVDEFWKKHKKHHEDGFFTAEFMDLMSAMLAFKPYLRPSIADIIGHDWL